MSATSASPGAVSYSIASGPATVAGNTVSITGMGIVVIKATQAASGLYNATSATTSIAVAAASPGLAIVPIPSVHYSSAPVTVSSTTASSGSILYSVVSGPATVSGNKVTLTGAGTVTLQANQAAAGNYPRCGRHNQLQREFLNALAGLHPDSPPGAGHLTVRRFCNEPVAGRYHLQRHERSRIGGGQCGDSYGCR